jgi:hypothetical protein
MIKPTQVPDLLVDLTKTVKDKSFYAGVVNNVHNGIHRAAEIVGRSESEYPAHPREMAEVYSEISLEKLPDSTIFYCDEDMSDLVLAGASVLDSTDMGDSTLLPSQEGFCYFAKGLKVYLEHVVHAISWRHIGKGVILVNSFNDTVVQADPFSKEWEEIVRKNTGWFPNTRWAHGSLMIYSDDSPINPIAKADSEKLAAMEIDSNMLTVNTVLHSLMLLLNQPTEIIETTKVSKQNKGSLKRAKKSRINPAVVVINIRRKHKKSSSNASDSPSFEYNVRWLVGGHWRWQPYKDALTREWKKKRIWISPYVKGPEDKPFVATKKVHALLK